VDSVPLPIILSRLLLLRGILPYTERDFSFWELKIQILVDYICRRIERNKAVLLVFDKLGSFLGIEMRL
jgi:hypothetical protein